MLQDKLLIRKCRQGRKDAASKIYLKYKDHLLTLAKALLNDKIAAEDIVQDVFLAFIKSIQSFKLTGSLKSYLSVCVINRTRDKLRAAKHSFENLDTADPPIATNDNPQQNLIKKEQATQLRQAIAKLPYQQREAVLLHLKSKMKFKQIAKLQNSSVSSTHARYRYGLKKLKTLLNSEAKK